MWMERGRWTIWLAWNNPVAGERMDEERLDDCGSEHMRTRRRYRVMLLTEQPGRFWSTRVVVIKLSSRVFIMFHRSRRYLVWNNHAVDILTGCIYALMDATTPYEKVINTHKGKEVWKNLVCLTVVAYRFTSLLFYFFSRYLKCFRGGTCHLFSLPFTYCGSDFWGAAMILIFLWLLRNPFLVSLLGKPLDLCSAVHHTYMYVEFLVHVFSLAGSWPLLTVVPF